MLTDQDQGPPGAEQPLQLLETVAFAALALAVLLLLVAAVSFRRARSVTTVSPEHARRPRLHSEATGIPAATIDDYSGRRFARGTAPPPGRQPVVAQIPLRPQLRHLTPVALDGLWDLTD